MSLFGSSAGPSKEQKKAMAANAALSDKSSVYGDYYSADQRRRNQALDAIKLYGIQGGVGTGVTNVSGGAYTGGLFDSNWGPGTFTDPGLSNKGPVGDYYTTKDPDIEVSKLQKMLAPNGWDEALASINKAQTPEDKKKELDWYLKFSGYSPGISGFSDEAINNFLKNPTINSSVPSDISVRKFRQSGAAGKVMSAEEKLLDPNAYYKYVMGSPAAQNMSRHVAEMTQLMKKEGPLYEDWMRTAEKGQKERLAIQNKETAKEIERMQGRSGTGVNRGRAMALQNTAARELSAEYARNWDEFLMDFTQRSHAMYENAIDFSNNWINDLGEFRSSTLTARDNLLQYRSKQLELEYQTNRDWMMLNPKQEGNAALSLIGGIMSVVGTILSVTPLAAVGVGLAAGGAVLSGMGSPGGGIDMTGAAMMGATKFGGGPLFGGGTKTSTGLNPYDKVLDSSGNLKISGQPWG